MNGTERTRFGKGDAVVIALVVLTALGMLLGLFLLKGDRNPGTVQVWQESQLLYELPLTTDTEVVVTGEYRNTITIRDGQVAITGSDCPGADCVHTGWVNRQGRSIVCLPNRVEIRLTGEPSVDALVQ